MSPDPSSLKNTGIKAQTLWTWEEAGHNQDGRKHQLELLEEEPFSTPKPESLIHRILHIATNPGDLVLDSFLGSGTTAAVAHKMGRRWIGVEMGNHARTHCALRLLKVIEGEQGGISEDVNGRAVVGSASVIWGKQFLTKMDGLIPKFALLTSLAMSGSRKPATLCRMPLAARFWVSMETAPSRSFITASSETDRLEAAMCSHARCCALSGKSWPQISRVT